MLTTICLQHVLICMTQMQHIRVDRKSRVLLPTGSMSSSSPRYRAPMLAANTTAPQAPSENDQRPAAHTCPAQQKGQTSLASPSGPRTHGLAFFKIESALRMRREETRIQSYSICLSHLSLPLLPLLCNLSPPAPSSWEDCTHLLPGLLHGWSQQV